MDGSVCLSGVCFTSYPLCTIKVIFGLYDDVIQRFCMFYIKKRNLLKTKVGKLLSVFTVICMTNNLQLCFWPKIEHLVTLPFRLTLNND